MPTKVLIAVQARSSSTRLPRKAFELIGGRPMLERVMHSCRLASDWLSRNRDMRVTLAILTPEGDDVEVVFGKRYDVVTGPLEDVLTRYALASAKYSPDYIVRVTGDCPMVPAYYISKMAELAVVNRYDYLTNADERYRTTPDGADVEVFSNRMLMHAHQRAGSNYDREHVTPYMRSHPPDWASLGFVCTFYDLSGIKLSVDTPADLERVREAFESTKGKFQEACARFGPEKVHRL